MRRTLFTLLTLLLASSVLSGCIYSREIARTRKDIERQYPGTRLDREIVLNLGPGSMRFLGFVTGLIPEEETEMASDYLRDIGRVKVGVYRVEDLPSLEDFDLSRLDRLQRDGWEVAVKSKQEDDVFWLMYRERRDTVRDLYIFALDEEEFVLARVRGNLSRLFQRIMEDHGAFTEWMDEE